MLIYFLITFIILIISLIYYYYETPKCHNLDFLNGYWISNDEFNANSDIDNMILYFDTDNVSNVSIIINNKLICNHEVTIDTTIDSNKDNNIYFKCSFNSDDDDFIWQDLDFNAILSINTGNLKLFNDNILYADLFKDNIITSYINQK
jgi:hypothetical protein